MKGIVLMNLAILTNFGDSGNTCDSSECEVLVNQFLSDPGIPGVRSMGPSLSK